MTSTKTFVCPCCGSNMATLPKPDHLGHLNLSVMEKALARTMLDAFPRTVSTDELVHSVYGSDPEGGPLSAAHSMKITMVNLRRKIKPSGWTVRSNRGGHGVLGQYQFTPLETGA